MPYASKKSKSDYMRAYMRTYRTSGRHNAPLSPKIRWLRQLRTAYSALLRAQHHHSAFSADALRIGADPTPPEHLTRALTEAGATLDALAAEHPELAQEYFDRVALADLERAIRDMTDPPEPARPRGRPRKAAAVERAALVEAEAATRAARAEAYTAHERAAEGGTPPAPAVATRLERACQRTRQAHERAAQALAEHDRAQQAAHEQALARAEQASQAAQALAALREQAQALRAALPDPPRAPLHEAPRDREAQLARAQRRRARAVVALTPERLAVLRERYTVHTDPGTGARTLARIATGRPVRTRAVHAPGMPACLVDEVIEALAPSGLV